MKLIGISGFVSDSKISLNTAYTNAFTRSDITPLVIPELILKNRELITKDDYAGLFKDHIDKYADSLDALVLSGGGDINPDTFDDENFASSFCDSIRDFMELGLLKAFIERDKPVMGICRGFQLIGRHLGFDNFQEDLGNTGELHSGLERDFKSRQEACHNVIIYGDYRKYINEIKKKEEEIEIMSVNSWHHQGFTFTRDGKFPNLPKAKGEFQEWFEKTTTKFEEDNDIDIIAATKLVLEGFKHRTHKIFGVQWHPEEYGNEGLTIQYFIDSYLGK